MITLTLLMGNPEDLRRQAATIMEADITAAVKRAHPPFSLRTGWESSLCLNLTLLQYRTALTPGGCTRPLPREQDQRGYQCYGAAKNLPVTMLKNGTIRLTEVARARN
jgi:hypothetical protein